MRTRPRGGCRACTGWKGNSDGAVMRTLASHQCGPGSTPGPGVICRLSLLLVLVLAPEVFLLVLRFSPFLKNQLLQIPIRSLVSPISSALVHGCKIETIIKLFVCCLLFVVCCLLFVVCLTSVWWATVAHQV